MATLTKNWQLLAETKMGSWGYGTLFLRLYGKYNSQNIASNTTNYSLEARVYCNGYYCNSGNCTATVGGVNIQNNVTLTFPTNGELTLGSTSITVTHNNTTGECNEIRNATFKCYALNFTEFKASATFSMPTIPRYATANQSLNSKTETTIVMNWSSDNTVDYVWHAINDGDWVGHDVTDGKSGTYTITGLSSNTTYNVKTRIRRKDNQLTTSTNNMSIITYDYPHCYITPDFTIGNAVYFTIFNPLNRGVKVTMFGDDDSVIWTGENWYGTSVGPNNASYPDVYNLYKSIPNSRSGRYKVSIEYGNSVRYTIGGVYSIKGTEKPTFSNFSYYDTNDKTISLTGNNQIIVNGYSNPYIYVPITDKAIANNSASIIKYRITVGNKSTEVTYSSTNVIGATLNSVNNETIQVTAIDSRGLETTVSKNVIWKNYTRPVFKNFNAYRKNGVSTTIQVDFNGLYWNDNFGNSQNNISIVTYTYKLLNDSTWSNDIFITNSAVTQNGNFNGSSIILPNSNNGVSPQIFEVGKIYNLRIYIVDKLGAAITSIMTVDGGMACTAKQKNSDGSYSVGINQLPEENYALSVKGAIKSDKSIVIQGNENINDGYKMGNDTILWHNTFSNMDTVLASNNGNIIFRPKGIENTTGQVYIDQNGVLGTNTVFVNGFLGQFAGSIKDFNTALTEGEYWIGGSGLTNYPASSTDYGKLIVKVSDGKTHNNSGNWIWQIFLSTSNNIYIRQKVNDGNWTNWRICNDVTLYENETGTTGTVTLSDYAYNYTYLEIFFRRNANTSFWGNHFYKSVRVYVPNDKIANLDIAYPAETYLTQIGTKLIGITGNTLINKRECYANINNNGTVEVGEQSTIYITKVIGYR